MGYVPDYLFNSSGQWIATLTDDRYLFDPQGKWVGWMPWDGADVADSDGKYLGTRYGDRLYQLIDAPAHEAPTAEPAPPEPEPMPRPPRLRPETSPEGTRNVDLGL
jgi:hypothetical protein